MSVGTISSLFVCVEFSIVFTDAHHVLASKREAMKTVNAVDVVFLVDSEKEH